MEAGDRGTGDPPGPGAAAAAGVPGKHGDSTGDPGLLLALHRDGGVLGPADLARPADDHGEVDLPASGAGGDSTAPGARGALRGRLFLHYLLTRILQLDWL